MNKSLESQLDEAIDELLATGWDDPELPTDVPPPVQAEPAEPEYPPLPVAVEPDYPPLPVREPPPEMEEGAYSGVLDIGLLTDLATGKKSALQAAEAAGVAPEALQSQLAVALREVPPEEITKAMGLQAAEQQLKSGALYGAVLSDLVGDMVSGRMKTEHKLELAKLLARVGKVDPSQDKGTGNVGGGFVLNISFGGSKPEPITVEG